MQPTKRVLPVVVVLLAALVLSACQPLIVTPAAVPQTEVNKEIVRRAFEEVWNQGKLDVVDEIVAPGRHQHEPTGDVIGPEGFKQLVTMYRTAFPDIQFTVHDQIAEGDKVVTRWSAIGTSKGEIMGIPPTGKRKEPTTGIVIDQIVDGKIAETWSSWDTLGFMQQLEVLPPMGREHFGWSEPSKVTGAPGDPETNKAIVRRYTDEVWNQGKLDVLDELMSKEVIGHEATTEHLLPQGIEGHKQAITAYLTAFPDLHATVEDLIAEGDLVADRWTATGTHKGELLGIPATGKQATWTGITIFRFADGKIAEMWWAWDALGLLQQIGAIPAPGQGGQ